MADAVATTTDPVDPVAVLRMLTEGLAATEASIVRLQAVREAHLAVAQRLAEEIAAAASEHARPDSADLASRSVAAELAGVLHMSDRVVQARMSRAADLMTRYPETMRAFSDARINGAHARLIHDAGAPLDDDARSRYEQAAVAACIDETPHRAKRAVERIAERLAPRSLTERHRDAQRNRTVWREDLPDGQKALGLIHSAAVIDGIYDRLTQQARLVTTENAKAARNADAQGRSGADGRSGSDGLGDPADTRTVDQLRADLCADLLLTATPRGHDSAEGLLAAIQARIELTVPALTLLASDATAGSAPDPGAAPAFDVRAEQPAELAGRQPIDARTARVLAGGATAWERVLTHPVTGAILAVDRYRPNADLRRLLHARDSRCRFPTCGLPPRTQDLDHTVDAALGGATEEGNLGGLCRRHHVLKHQTAWTVRQRGAGVLEWTSPTGYSYIDRPPSPVTFTIDDQDPDPPWEKDPAAPGF
ncbi:HNH endonuclease signature motif containing protein [Microbacterium azadirachtae]|nr:HNH endonuclease signature motif containing protein [Microbacterium azadirachtae]